MDIKNIDGQKFINNLKVDYYIFMFDLDGIIHYVNDTLLKFLEMNEKNVIGQSYKTFSSKVNDINKIEKAINSEKSSIFKIKLINSNKKSKLLTANVTPLKSNPHRISYKMLFIAHKTFEIKNKNKYLMEEDSLKQLIDIKNAIDETSIIAITDKNGMINYVNDQFCEISKYSKEELIGKSHRIVNSKYHDELFFKNLWDTIKRGEIWTGEIRNKAKDSSYYWVKTTIVPFLNRNGEIVQFISIRTDITSRVIAEEKLAITMENDFNELVKHLQNGVFRLKKRHNEKIVFILSEGLLLQKLNLHTEITKEKTVFELFPIDEAELLHYYFSKAFNNKNVKFEIPLTIGKEKYFLYITLSPILKNSKIKEVIGSVIDITKRKLYENKIKYLAHYDTLTNLVNRTYFDQLLTKYIEQIKHKQGIFSILLIDLDNFKNVNDMLGYSIGDEILKDITKYLKSNIEFKDIVARRGSDEFSILLKNIDRIEAGKVANRIIKNMRKVLTHYQFGSSFTASIGISSFPKDGVTTEDLMKSAYLALSSAKSLGKNNYQYFTTELSDLNFKKIQLEKELRKALINNELELYYQPKMNLKENKIIGFEALIRWNNEKLGRMVPNEFIKIAEETGLIVSIGEWIINTACKQLKKWHEAGYHQFTMAVNISFRQFIQSDLPIIVRDALKRTNLDPQFLELEITESMSMEPNYAMKSINKLKEIGVKVSIDDFGTGYSSLNYLSKLNIDCLKIDQSFLRELNKNNKTIIKTIIILAKNLNIEVIAEGIEKKEHIQFLLAEKCYEGQGYYFSRPLPANKVESWMKNFA